MTIEQMLVKAIRKLEDKMVTLEYCEADCELSRQAKEQEIDHLRHLRIGAIETLIESIETNKNKSAA